MLLSQIRKLHAASTSTSCAYANTLRHFVETTNLRKVKSVHAELIKMDRFESGNLFIRNHLMNAYVKCGEMRDGLQVFDEMPLRNMVSWTVLIAGFVRNDLPIEAFSLFSDMRRSHVSPNEHTFVSTLHACSFAEALDLVCALQVYALIIKFGFGGNTYLMNAFLTALIRHGKLASAVHVFEGCVNKDIVMWNALFSGYLKYCCQDIPQLWHRMTSEGMKPDEFTFATVLSGLAELSNLEMGLQVHALLVKSGHGSERCIGNVLVDMYLKNQVVGDGFRAFEEIPIKDVCSWTQLAAGCLNCGQPIEALRVIEQMRTAGVRLNKFTLSTGLNACANLASLDEGVKLQGLMMKLGDNMDTCVDNALLDMYAKCGRMDGAWKIFRSMNERSVVSWTTMIMGYAQNGQSGEALEIFEQMKQEEESRVKPNGITFLCVVYACCQAGYAERGVEILSSMKRDYGVSPGEEHYACIVDLLGRAGRIREAEELILGMPPINCSSVIWKTLLNSCRIYGDMETAKRAAEHAFAVAENENDSSLYVLLSNTFADLQNWGSLATLRESIRTHKLQKLPASTWLEINQN